MDTFWTDEVIETASRMWKAGDSGDVIAAAISAPSRSAVIGKMFRLGVKRDETSNEINRRRGSKSVGGYKPIKSAKPKAPKQTKPKRQFVCVESFSWEDGMSAPKTLLELGKCECKWPVGQVPEGGGVEQLFCGRKISGASPYCIGHSRISVNSGSSATAEKDIDFLIRRFAA